MLQFNIPIKFLFILITLSSLSPQVSAQDINQWLIYHLENIELPYDSITASLIEDNGQLWVGSHNGLWVINGNQIREYSYKDGLFNKDIHDIYVSNQGQVWVATSGGPFAFVNNHFYVFESLKDIKIWTINENNDIIAAKLNDLIGLISILLKSFINKSNGTQALLSSGKSTIH